QETAASEILKSFYLAMSDGYGGVGRQCVTLAALVLFLALPLGVGTASRLASEILARQVQGPQPMRQATIAGFALVLFGLLSLVGTVAPLLGLTLPLIKSGSFAAVWTVVQRTAANTLGYAFGAGMTAVMLAQLLAFFVGRSGRYRTAVVFATFLLFSL